MMNNSRSCNCSIPPHLRIKLLYATVVELVLMVSMLSGASLVANAGTEIVLLMKPDVTVSGAQVTISDLAEDPSSLPSNWEDRQIMKSPEPGKSASLPLMRIASALHQYPDMADVTLRGAVYVDIHREGTALDLERVKEAVEEYVAGKDDWKDLKVKTEFVKPSECIMVVTTNVTVNVLDFDYDARFNAHMFRLELRAVDGSVQQLKIPVRVSMQAQAWVAARPLKEGAVLADGDARAEWITTDASGRNYIPASDPVAGYEVQRPMLACEPIIKTAVRQPVCAEKGSAIEVTARRGDLEVSVRSKALSRGRRGDEIMCLNESSKRQILARLTASGKADLVGL